MNRDEKIEYLCDTLINSAYRMVKNSVDTKDNLTVGQMDNIKQWIDLYAKVKPGSEAGLENLLTSLAVDRIRSQHQEDIA